MSFETQALYNQTNILSWKTSYPISYVKDAPEPPIQKYTYLSKIFPPDKILKRYIHNKSNKYVWQISVSPDGMYIIILKNNNLELRSSKLDFTQIIFQCQIYKDIYPQWRTICWSNSSNFFGVSFSNGMVNLWDIQGVKLSFNSNCIRSNDFDVIIKLLIYEISKVKVKLFVLTLNGKVIVYNINNFKVINNFQSNIKFISTPILCCDSIINSNNLVIGTYNQVNKLNTNEAFKTGIVLCKIVDEDPFIVPNCDTEHTMPANNSWFSFFCSKTASDAIFCIRISKDSNKLVALHFSGKISVWKFPPMILCFTWSSSTNLTNPSLKPESLKHNIFPNHFNDCNIVHIGWWNSEYVTLALSNGRIIIIGLDQSVQSNNEQITLNPFPQIEESVEKTFFALNCISKSLKSSHIDRNSVQTVERTSSWNVFGILLNYFLSDTQSAMILSNPDFSSQNYTMIGFTLTTPEELLAIRINKKQYSEALLLATQYGLDADLVFKKQWRDSQKTIDDIKQILIKIKKRNWILNECLEQIPESMDSMKFLLKLGFYLSDIDQWECADEELEEELIETMGSDFRNSYVNESVIDKLIIDQLSLVQIEMIRIRTKLINYCDKLIVYEKILKISKHAFQSELFRELKNLSSFEISIKFARDNNINGLRVVLDFYHDILSKHILTILSNIPESVKPLTYREIIIDNLPPFENNKTLSVTKELDWCELKKFSQIYNTDIMLNESENLYYQKNPDQSSFIIKADGDCVQTIRDWCHMRVRKIEFETFNASNALELLQIFKELNEDIDSNLEFNLRFLYEGIYNCQITNAFLSLVEFEILSDFEKAAVLMSKTSPERFIVNFNHWIMPMLEEINIESSERSLKFTQDYLVNLGKKNLICVRKLLEDNDSMCKLMEVVKLRDIVNFYISVLCNDDEVTNVAECAHIARVLKLLTPEEYISELKQIQDVQDYISVLKILEKYELKKTIKFVHEHKMNGELVENLITNMVFQYLKKVKNVNKVIIKSVFTEIQIALSLVFKSVHPKLIYKNLLKSMLESGDKKKINLACEFMILTTNINSVDDVEYEEKLVDFPEAVQCILLAVRNYVNMSTSSKDSNILLAKYCLDRVINPTEEIIAELEIIKCSEFLDKWHCSLVPIEIRAVENRFELLTKCLEKNKLLYREMEEVIEVGTHLYADRKTDKKFREGEALRLIAQKAWSNNDRENLEISMSSLLHRDHKPCWKECVMTLKLFDYPIEKKSALGKYAMTNCPDSVLTETVRFINEVELASLTLSESQSKEGSQSSANTNSNSNLITQPIKYLSSGLSDWTSKINLKSLIDRSSDTLSMLTTQVTQLGSRGSQEVLYRNDNRLLKTMTLDPIYQQKGHFSLKAKDDQSVNDIVRALSLPLVIGDQQSENDTDQLHLKMVHFNVNRDTFLAIVHAIFIKDVNLVYNLRNDLPANTYSRALVYSMVGFNLILKYSKRFPVLNKISTDSIESILSPLKKEMCESELTILRNIDQEFQDYVLLDKVIANVPSVCMNKFFGSVDYRRTVIFQLCEFSDNVQLLPCALKLASRYNIDSYEILWTYFLSFVAKCAPTPEDFDNNYQYFKEVFDMDGFIHSSATALRRDLEKHLVQKSAERVSEFRVILKLLLLVKGDSLVLFSKTSSEHRQWMEIFDQIFTNTDTCDYADLCSGNKVVITGCLKKVVNVDNVDKCDLLLTAFNLSEEFTKIKNEFSSVLANQTLWSKPIVDSSSNYQSEFLLRFEKSLKNFSITDYENSKNFIYSALFERTETYLSLELKIRVLKCAAQFIDTIVNSTEVASDKWSSVSLEVTIWLDHLENTVVKVAKELRLLASVSDRIVVNAEYMPPENYWHTLITEMLLEDVTYGDLFTLTWNLNIDSFVIEDAVFTHICHICSSEFLRVEEKLSKLNHILEELDDMDFENVEGLLERALDEQLKDSNEHIHRLFLDELVFRVRKNKSKLNLPINQHIVVMLKNLGLPVNEKISFERNNLHLIDNLMQDCDSPEKMKLIPKVIELIELVEVDNNLWQCWIKACVIKGAGYCLFIFDQFEDLRKNKLYNDRIDRLAKDAIQSLTAFNPAEAISILIFMDPIEAVDKVQHMITSLKSDPAEYVNTMKNLNVKALQIIVEKKLIPNYVKSGLYQRLVNFITKEMNDANVVQEVLEQLKEHNLQDEATWLTSSSSHINPAMKTIEMVSGFWKRFSNA